VIEEIYFASNAKACSVHNSLRFPNRLRGLFGHCGFFMRPICLASACRLSGPGLRLSVTANQAC